MTFSVALNVSAKAFDTLTRIRRLRSLITTPIFRVLPSWHIGSLGLGSRSWINSRLPISPKLTLTSCWYQYRLEYFPTNHPRGLRCLTWYFILSFSRSVAFFWLRLVITWWSALWIYWLPSLAWWFLLVLVYRRGWKRFRSPLLISTTCRLWFHHWFRNDLFFRVAMLLKKSNIMVTLSTGMVAYTVSIWFWLYRNSKRIHITFSSDLSS